MGKTNIVIFFKVIGFGAPSITVFAHTTTQDLKDFVKSCRVGARFTLGARFDGLPEGAHMTLVCCGGSENPNFDALITEIIGALFRLRTVVDNAITDDFALDYSIVGRSLFGQNNDLNVALVRLETRELIILNRLNALGFREDGKKTEKDGEYLRIFHITMQLYKDSPDDFREFVNDNMDSFIITPADSLEQTLADL
jgi:hypothetical protein